MIHIRVNLRRPAKNATASTAGRDAGWPMHMGRTLSFLSWANTKASNVLVATLVQNFPRLVLQDSRIHATIAIAIPTQGNSPEIVQDAIRSRGGRTYLSTRTALAHRSPLKANMPASNVPSVTHLKSRMPFWRKPALSDLPKTAALPVIKTRIMIGCTRRAIPVIQSRDGPVSFCSSPTRRTRNSRWIVSMPTWLAHRVTRPQRHGYSALCLRPANRAISI